MSRSVFGVRRISNGEYLGRLGDLATAKLYQTKRPASAMVNWKRDRLKQEWETVEFVLVENLHNLS